MSNRWGIPKEVESAVLLRDTNCVYCQVPFSDFDNSYKLQKSWEHIINDITLNDINNIALCCRSCNASKGNKPLKDWLESSYCARKGINVETVAAVVRNKLK